MIIIQIWMMVVIILCTFFVAYREMEAEVRRAEEAKQKLVYGYGSCY